MLEWQEIRNKDFTEHSIINWQLKGELTLDLKLAGGIEEITNFELARFLIQPHQVIDMVRNLGEAKSALRGIHKSGYYLDIIWVGYSPEALEEYFKKQLLPLPPNYQEQFTRIDSQWLTF